MNLEIDIQGYSMISFKYFFCLTVPSVVFTHVQISPDGTNWSPINFTPVKIGPTGYSK